MTQRRLPGLSELQALAPSTLGAAEALEPVRLSIQRNVRRFLTGSDEAPTRDLGPRNDPGLFGPGSVAWRIHADASMLVGGLRALLFQTLQPGTMAGVAQHSAYKTDPLGRLQRTANFVGTTTFGTTAEAEASLAMVRRVHRHVRGSTRDGVPYDASDPHLIGWVHATEVDSFMRAYQRYGGAHLNAADADRYVDEMAEVGRRLGLSDPPTSVATLQATLDSYRAELEATPEARDAVKFLLWPPFPTALRPVYGAIASGAVGLLPNYARRLLWLPLTPGAEPLLVRPAAFAVTRVLGWALAAPAAPSAAASA